MNLLNKRFTLALLTATFLVLFGARLQAEPEKTFDLSTPEKTLHSFVDAVNRYDAATAARCVKGGQAPVGLQKMWTEISQNFKMVHRIGKLQVTPDKDRATAQFETTVTMDGHNTSLPEKLELQRIAGSWKIYVVPNANSPYAPTGYLGMRAAEIVDAENTVRFFNRAKSVAQRHVCHSRLEELAGAALKHAAANNGRFTLKADHLKPALLPYLESEEAFTCTANTTSSYSYSFNRHLEGKRLKSIKRPSKVVMFYEGSGQKLSYRHIDSETNQPVANVAFADGSVRSVTREEANTLLWR